MEKQLVEKASRASPSLFGNGWIDRMLSTPLDEYLGLTRVMNVPAVNVSENEKEYIVSLAAPGMDRKDFHVETAEDMLTISAEKEKEEKEERNGRYNRREYNYSSWSRSFSLPEDCNAEKIDAEYKGGELRITIPKTATKKPKNTHSIPVA
jgi:HSP20 family protein